MPRPSEKRISISIRAPLDLHAKIREAAESDQRSMAQFCLRTLDLALRSSGTEDASQGA